VVIDRRSASGSRGRGIGGFTDGVEELSDDQRVSEDSEDLATAATIGALENIEAENVP
jgi:hypothetical protein